MTKQSIVSILKEISSSFFCGNYSKAGEPRVLMFNSDDKVFYIATNAGIIYCNCVKIDNTKLIDFINDGKIIAILDYSFIEKIDLL